MANLLTDFSKLFKCKCMFIQKANQRTIIIIRFGNLIYRKDALLLRSINVKQTLNSGLVFNFTKISLTTYVYGMKNGCTLNKCTLNSGVVLFFQGGLGTAVYTSWFSSWAGSRSSEIEKMFSGLRAWDSDKRINSLHGDNWPSIWKRVKLVPTSHPFCKEIPDGLKI